MSEKQLRRVVVNMLSPLDAVAVENPAYPGTPDVNFVEGWIELKVAERWPPQGGILRLEHFTQHQRVWLLRRWRRGGRALLLLRVGREWLLFDGETAAKIVGRADKNKLLASAARHWPNRPSGKDLIRCVLAISPEGKSSSSPAAGTRRR